MIDYDAGYWGIAFVFQKRGSVFQKAFWWALPCAAVTVALCFALPGALDVENFNKLWTTYTGILGFLVVFRNNLAYGRFWEGITLACEMRGEWLNAVSSLLAFTCRKDEKRQSVGEFQHLVVRLMSLLHCAALQTVACVEDDQFEVITPHGMEVAHLKFLAEQPDRCEVLLQWIQRAIVDASSAGIIEVAPPILSRVYQELGRGHVKLQNLRKLKEVPFPFPYAQTTTTMMLFHWLVTPLISSQLVENAVLAGLISFSVVFALWSLSYIALELEQPFGEDANDVPVEEMQKDLNRSLVCLLDERVQSPPKFFYDPALHGMMKMRKSDAKCMEGQESQTPARLQGVRILGADMSARSASSSPAKRSVASKSWRVAARSAESSAAMSYSVCSFREIGTDPLDLGTESPLATENSGRVLTETSGQRIVISNGVLAPVAEAISRVNSVASQNSQPAARGREDVVDFWPDVESHLPRDEGSRQCLQQTRRMGHAPVPVSLSPVTSSVL